MALVVKDRVRVTTTTTGTSDFALGSAVTGYQSFSVIGNNNTTYYVASDPSTGDWEVGVGTFLSAGPTLTRDTILESSNAGSKVVFAAGAKDLFVSYPAERAVYLNAAGSAVDVLDIGTLGTSTANISNANITAGTVSTTPTAATDIANKSYVDTIASSGITYHTPVKYEVPNTTGNLNATYNNGVAGVGATLTNAGTKAAFAPDGPTAQVGDRILIYNQTNAYENGVYEVTTVGTPDPGGTNWVLTRTADADSYAVKDPNALGSGDAFFITSGNTGAGETYVCNTVGTITFGTTAITFVQVSDATLYTAGTGLTLSGTQFSITPVGTAGTYGSASQVPVIVTNASGQVSSVTNTAIAITAGAVSGLAASATTDTTNANNITSGTLNSARLSGSYTGITGVGTLTAGTWNAGTIGVSYGGTGLTSYAVGDLLYADTTTSLAKLADVVVGNALISGGVGTAPSWGKIGLTTHVSGTLGVANGGTGAATLTGYVYGNGTGAFTASTSIPNGATTATSANTASAIVARDASGNFSAGTITAALSGNASTATSATTATNLAGGSVGTIPYQTAAATTAMLAVGTSGQYLKSNGAAAPSWDNLPAVNNGTLTMNVSGTGLSGSATFTANQSGNSTFTVSSNATSSNTASTIVARDASGNFSAGTITASLSGNATSATTSTNLAGGSAGTVPYQSAAGTTAMLAAGTAGFYLQANGAAAPSWVAPPTIGNGTLTMNVSGNGLSGSQTFTANQSSNATYTVTSNATDANTASTIVFRDASGNFSAGTITANLTGTATNADAVNSISAVNLYNNMGQVHSTRTAFDATSPSYGFGYRFVQGSTNGPGTGGTQFYSWYIGLGSDYLATGANSYGAMFAVDRNSSTPYLSVRFNEGNTFTSWYKIRAGYADSAGNVNNGTLTMNVSGTGLSGSATFTANQAGNSTFTVTSNATDLNTASTIVARNASGNFAAGTITANLSGNATTATTATNLAGGSAGTVPYQSAAGTTAMLAAGSAGQYLQSNGAAAPSWATLPTIGNGTLTLAVSGNGLSGSASFTANQTGGSTFTVTSNATAANTVNTIAFRDANGGFNIGYVNNNTWYNYNDNDRNAGSATYYPNASARAVRYFFANASSTGTGGNYAGVLQFNPWDGTTSSTGDASYQLAFGSTATNGGGIPQLNIRKGIDTTWNSWYTILHSGNYNSYSPTLTGGGASGTWSINVTGNAATATNASYAYNYTQSFASNWNTDFSNAPAGSMILRGDTSTGSSTGGPGGTWWFQQNFRHTNASNVWGVQIAWGWEDNQNQLKTRNVSGGSYGSWISYLNSSNYNSYSPTLTGTGASGTWGINITGSAGSSTNLLGGALGSIPYQSASGTTAFLAAGTAGQYLQANGAAAPSWVTPPTIGNGTLTLGVSGNGLSGSATFTANQTGASTFTVTSNATSANTASTIVYRDGAGGFAAGAITATAGSFSSNITVGTAAAVDPSNVNGFAAGQITESTTGFSAPGMAFGSGAGSHAAIVYGSGTMYFGTENGSDNTMTTRATLTSAGAFNTTGAITQNGSQVLTAGNYNSYAPTLTGTGASGTWGINITGNAATATSASNVNNGTLSMGVSGNGLSGSATFTANQSGNSTFTVTSNATSANTASTIVYRDASGNFSANAITTAADSTISTLTIGRGAGSISSNTAIGVSALAANTTGSNNTAVGNGALISNTTTNNSTAIGDNAMYYMRGNSNTAVGRQALFGSLTPANNTGANNVGVGYLAMSGLTGGISNTGVGTNSLRFLNTGSFNVGVGAYTLEQATLHSYQVAVGYSAMTRMGGNRNVAVGADAMYGSATFANNFGADNIAIGYQALYGLTSGNFNVGIGYQALELNTSASNNVAIGGDALGQTTTGGQNVAVGFGALFAATGTQNTAIGESAGTSITTGTKNTIIGRYTGNQGGLNISTLSNYIVLSDGDGNPRGYFDNNGNYIVGADIRSTSQNGGQLAGMRNLIINGNMVIDQRNNGAAIPYTAAITTNLVDRFIFFGSVATRFTIQQNQGSVTPPAGFANYLGFTSSAATTPGASDIYFVWQRIEGFNSAHLAFGTSSAKTVTFSFWVRSSLTGTFSGAVFNSAANRNYVFTYSISAANTWQYKSVTITGDTTGTWLTNDGIGVQIGWDLGSGTSRKGTAGTWSATALYGSTGSVNVVGTLGATFYVTGVQFEVGSVATPFENRNFATELAMCQRYYEVGGDISLWSGYAVNGSTYYSLCRFATRKRANPTVVSTYVAASGFPATAPATLANRADQFWASAVCNTTMNGGYFQFSWTANAEL